MTLLHLEREYNLRIRHEFDVIDNRMSELIKQKRQHYEHLRKMIE